jgi:hypothetical protein
MNMSEGMNDGKRGLKRTRPTGDDEMIDGPGQRVKRGRMRKNITIKKPIYGLGTRSLRSRMIDVKIDLTK